MKKCIARLFLILSAATLLCMPAQIFASVSNDQVLSQHVKEADGTSGQNTNSGSGIKTGHIQNGAVTDAKITGPISGSKLGSHTHSGSNITDGTITTPKIADGAVTPSKIGFYSNVIIVAPSGGDFTSPVDAMNSITDASASNPYLVKIMPGVYEIGPDGMVSLKDFVDIEGSGKEVTKITKTTATGGNPTVGHDLYAPPYHSEMRNITVEKISTASAGYFDTFVVGIGGGATPKYSNMNIIASGGYSAIGIYVTNSAPIFQNVSVIATGNPAMGTEYAQGVLLSGAGPDNLPYIFDNLSVKASGANFNYGFSSAGIDCVVLIRNSSIYGSTLGLEAGNLSQFNSNIKVNNSSIKGDSISISISQGHFFSAAGTQLDGQIINGGTTKLVNCHDGNFNAIPNQ